MGTRQAGTFEVKAGAICPILTAAQIIRAGPPKLVHQLTSFGGTDLKTDEVPAALCLRDACALFVPTSFEEDGKVKTGGCALGLVPSALMAVQGAILRSLEQSKGKGS